MEGNDYTLDLKGILRSKSKLNVPDGQCDDLVNLRFKDGSWCTSDGGTQVYDMGDTVYCQLFVHTNVYRHLLGVRDNQLWWFADIDSDGVFTAKETPISICIVSGSIAITQTGHLLTIVDDAGANGFDYYVYHTYTDTYKSPNIDENGKSSDKGIYPFGQVKLNFELNTDSYEVKKSDWQIIQGLNESFLDFTQGNENSGWLGNTRKSEARAYIQEVLANMKSKNKFTRPFLACVAIELYDGSFVLASNPIFMFPNEAGNMRYKIANGNTLSDCRFIENGWTLGIENDIYRFFPLNEDSPENSVYVNNNVFSFSDTIPSVWNGYIGRASMNYSGSDAHTFHNETSNYTFKCYGSDLNLYIENSKILEDNKDLFKSVCIFITPEVEFYKYQDAAGTDTDVVFNVIRQIGDNGNGSKLGLQMLTYDIELRDKSDIIYDLTHSNFYLLKRLTVNNNLNGTVDLSGTEDEGLLANIVQSTDILPTVANSRTAYLPKCTYSYNGRLHLANYTSYQFHGYPLNWFFGHNAGLVANSNSAYCGITGYSEAEGNPQWRKVKTNYIKVTQSDTYYEEYVSKLIQKGRSFAFVKVTIEGSEAEQTVVRYVKPSSNVSVENSLLCSDSYLYSLNPLLTFPDVRAKEMTIYYCVLAYNNNIYTYSKTFTLTKHPYLNLAYYIDPEMKPITLDNVNEIRVIQFNAGDVSGVLPIPDEANTQEYFPNGLKVSKIDNPLYFPPETTYLVGSSEIVALSSNTIAVGTGQTGAAPLYVFCKDGIYGEFVDSSGEICYINSRILTRDVLNNPFSVTPIDNGVVFTTDRGLMMIAGEQVQEIGQPAEGDYLKFADSESVDNMPIVAGAFSNSILADMSGKQTDTDFLTYISEAKVSYNHNERELFVSNPNKSYSYILDRYGNWTRRMITADEYLDNYPVTYRVFDGKLYQTDINDNKPCNVFFITRPVKLGTVNFKQAYRFALRGYFDTNFNIYANSVSGTESESHAGLLESLYSVDDNMNIVVPGRSYRVHYTNLSSKQIKILVGIKKSDNTYLTDLYPNEYCEAGESADFEFTIPTTYNDETVERVELFAYSGNEHPINNYSVAYIIYSKKYLGCYVLGSYDGRKWSFLGGNEKKGTFTDLGCIINRYGCKYFIFCLAGGLTYKSRLDYMEIVVSGSRLLTSKIR